MFRMILDVRRPLLMTRCHSLFLLCAFFSLHAYSGSVTFAQWIPWNFLSEEMKKSDVQIHEERPSLVLSLGDFKPELSNLSVSINGETNGISSSGNILFSEARGSFVLNIGAIKIDQIIKREFGGNVISVRIQATCGAASVALPSVSVATSFSKNSSGLPVLRDLSLQIPSGTWSISPLHCEGLSGIGEEIEASLNSALKDPGLFTPYIREWIAPRMNQWMQEQWLLIADGDNWKNLHIASSDEKGFFLRGDIILSGSEEVGLTENLPSTLIGDRPKFFMSRAGYVTLIQDRMRTVMPMQYDLRQEESFRKLMNSRFMQYIAWPDLRRFHPSTPFVLKNDPMSLKLSLTQNQASWKADLSGKGSLVTLVSGSPIDYIVYSMSVSVPVTMELRNGDLYFSTGKASAKIAWAFGYLYQLLYKAENKIPLNILTTSLGNLASDRIQKVALPRFQFGDRELVLSNLVAQENLITMEWL